MSLKNKNFHRNMILRILIASTFTAATACTKTPPSQETKEESSLSAGPLAVGLRSPVQMQRWSTKVKQYVGPSKLKPYPEKRKAFRSAIVRATVEDFGGELDFQQLFGALGNLLAEGLKECAPELKEVIDVIKEELNPTETPVSWGSCEPLFGVSQNELEGFLEDLKTQVKIDPSLKVEKIAQRDALLKSLSKNKSWANKSFSELELSFPSVATPRSTRPSGISNIDLRSSLKPQDITAIQTYLTTYEKAVYAYLASDSPEKVFKDPTELQKYNESKSILKTIDSALAVQKKTPGTVYRGLGHISQDKLTQMITQYANRSVIRLGRNGLPSIVSSSWDPEIAIRFVMLNSPNGIDNGWTYGVLYRIKQHSGVSVESISEYKSQREVMLPSTSRYQITGFSRLGDYCDYIVLVDLVEVLDVKKSM